MTLKKQVTKSIAIALIGITISSPIFGTIHAAERTSNNADMIQSVIQEDVDGISNCFGLTGEEKDKLIQDVIDYHAESENTGNRVKRGKLSISIKVMRKIWRKLPFKVRQTLVQHTGVAGVGALQTVLSTVDHFTGAIEDGIYKGCRNVGMSKNVAWWVTKAITLFL